MLRFMRFAFLLPLATSAITFSATTPTVPKITPMADSAISIVQIFPARSSSCTSRKPTVVMVVTAMYEGVEEAPALEHHVAEGPHQGQPADGEHP